MLKNYLLTAIRNIIKNKLFSFINISGLTLGMAIFLFIMHYVDFERSYDTFHKKSDRIYRLRYERTDKSGEAVRFASCCPPAGLRIRANLPEVEKVARIFRSTGTVQYGEKLFYEEKIFFAENEIFSIFDIKFIAGNPETGISDPNKAFISKSIAKKYFGDTNPMEKMFSIDKKTVYEIAGVFEDLPANSHIKIDFLLSYKTLIAKFGEEVEESWGDSGWYTYLLFKRNADIAGFNRRLKNIESVFYQMKTPYRKLLILPLTKAVFAASTAPNFVDYLLGKQEKAIHKTHGVESLVSSWKSRWMEMRMNKPEIAAAIRNFSLDMHYRTLGFSKSTTALPFPGGRR